MQNLDPTVVIRAARGSDGEALENLARLDSQRPLAGDVLVADPFRPTAEVLELLRIRAGRTAHRRRHGARVRLPRLRAA